MSLTKQDLEAISKMIKPLNQRLDKVDQRLDKVDKKLLNVEKDIQGMKEASKKAAIKRKQERKADKEELMQHTNQVVTESIKKLKEKFIMS